MQEGVNNMRSGSISSISVHNNPVALLDDNNLQYTCNYYPTCDLVIPKVSIYNGL